MEQYCPMAHEGCRWFKSDQSPELAEMPCYCFNEKDNGMPYVLATCRNHHWGLIHLCKPDVLRVTFYIEQIVHRSLEEHLDLHTNHLHRRLVWFRVDMSFDKVVGVWDKPAGWYKTTLSLSEGEFYGHKDIMDGLLGLLTLVLLLWFLVRHLVTGVAFFPYRARQLWLLRDPSNTAAAVLAAGVHADQQGDAAGDQRRPAVIRDIFEKRLVLLIDGDGHRSRYLSVAGIVWENIIAVVVTISFIMSAWFQHGVMMPSEDESFGMVSNWQYINRNLSGTKKYTEVLYDIFFDSAAAHGLAWILLYLRTVFFFLGAISGLKWLPVTIILACARSIYFMIAYSIMIVGFANVFYIQFGARFVQFSFISRASYELFLLSCGVPGYVFEDIYPWQDRVSLYASLYLAFYMLLAITIGLNFFTTIMLDAYSLAQDPEAADEIISEGLHTVSEALMRLIGVRADADEGDGGDVDAETRGSFRPTVLSRQVSPGSHTGSRPTSRLSLRPSEVSDLSNVSAISGDPMSTSRRKGSGGQRPSLFT